MSLIHCPECGREISDKANNCPNCGYPIASIPDIHQLSSEYEQKRKEKSEENIIKILIASGVVIFLVIMIGLSYYHSGDSKRAQKRQKDSVEELDKTAKEIESLEDALQENQRQIDLYK